MWPSSLPSRPCFDMSAELRELLINQAESPPSLREHLGERPHLRDVQPAVVRGVGGSRPADRQCARHLTDDQTWCACPLRRLVCTHVAIVLVQAITSSRQDRHIAPDNLNPPRPRGPCLDQAGGVECSCDVNRLVERQPLPVDPSVLARDEGRHIAAGAVRPRQQLGSRSTATGCTVRSPLTGTLNQITTSTAGLRLRDVAFINLNEAPPRRIAHPEIRVIVRHPERLKRSRRPRRLGATTAGRVVQRLQPLQILALASRRDVHRTMVPAVPVARRATRLRLATVAAHRLIAATTAMTIHCCEPVPRGRRAPTRHPSGSVREFSGPRERVRATARAAVGPTRSRPDDHIGARSQPTGRTDRSLPRPRPSAVCTFT